LRSCFPEASRTLGRVAERRRDAQLELFTSTGQGDLRNAAVDPVRVSAEVAGLADRLPRGLRLGTSSWSFPGWVGIVYGGPVTGQHLARSGLAAYARHPLLRSVGIDRSFYGPTGLAEYTAYASAVPDEFRFLVKAHEALTFPHHACYGVRAGEPNPLYLDAGYARDAVVGPCLEGLGAKTGAIPFQFPPQPLAELGPAQAFAERLHGFLAALPRGARYAVELRTRTLFTDAYAALVAAGAVHCLNVHPAMPGVSAQRALANGSKEPTWVVRWMLHPGFDSESARKRYAPFDRLVDEDLTTRSSLARICLEGSQSGKEEYVIIHNKAEGSAPLSAFALAAAIVTAAKT
jgi:uncharacterized protein YecE (DUF72 family)